MKSQIHQSVVFPKAGTAKTYVLLIVRVDNLFWRNRSWAAEKERWGFLHPCLTSAKLKAAHSIDFYWKSASNETSRRIHSLVFVGWLRLKTDNKAFLVIASLPVSLESGAAGSLFKRRRPYCSKRLRRLNNECWRTVKKNGARCTAVCDCHNAAGYGSSCDWQ